MSGWSFPFWNFWFCGLVAAWLKFSFSGRLFGWSIPLWNFWCCCLVAFNLTFSFLGLDSLDEAFLSGISDSAVLLLFYSVWEVGASWKLYSRLCTVQIWEAGSSWWEAIFRNSDDEERWGFISCSGSCFIKVKLQCNLREADILLVKGFLSGIFRFSGNVMLNYGNFS